MSRFSGGKKSTAGRFLTGASSEATQPTTEGGRPPAVPEATTSTSDRIGSTDYPLPVQSIAHGSGPKGKSYAGGTAASSPALDASEVANAIRRKHRQGPVVSTSEGEVVKDASGILKVKGVKVASETSTPSCKAVGGQQHAAAVQKGSSSTGSKGTGRNESGKGGSSSSVGGCAGSGIDTKSESPVKAGRRCRLWRVAQWLLAVGAVFLALAGIPRRLYEEAVSPMYVSEMPSVGFLPQLGPLSLRLNVSLPPLILPRRSLDTLIASTGFNVSSLFGLTDTLNDLTDTISTARLTLTMRGLLSQLPAFSGPAGGSGSGSTGAGAGNAGGDESGLRPGLVMARRGYIAKHPVVIVPGFVTSALELWKGLPCGQRYFRQRMWGTLAMVQAFLTDPSCWFRHMELDPVTGLDPSGIKIRAAMGLEAVDYFIQGYWVWGKLVEALADVGYDSNNLVSMPYDWRLAMPLLQERDGYFTRLRLAVEALTEVHGERVVITTHSYGENVVRSFMSWVEADELGWVEQHVKAVINIAGTSLGVPKSVSALLSGETRDTAQLGALAGFLSSNLVPRVTRTRVWRTWGASYALLPVGGARVWGNVSWAPDDTPEMRAEGRTYGAMVSLWPHDWQMVLAAAAAAPPQQREELRCLVKNVGESATLPTPPPESQQPTLTPTPTSASPDVSTVAAAPAGVPDDDGAASGNGTNSSRNSSSGNGSCIGGSSSSSSSSSPMAMITDTLKRLVSSGSSDINPAEFLDSEHVTRLDVSGFLAMLKEVGGPLVEQHVNEWAAVELSQPGSVGREKEPAKSESVSGMATPTAATIADGDMPQEAQSTGDTSGQLRQTLRRRAALFPDATRTPLPNAPTTAIVCLYGVGLPTERGYHYLRPPLPPATPPSRPLPQHDSKVAVAAEGSCTSVADAAAAVDGGATEGLCQDAAMPGITAATTAAMAGSSEGSRDISGLGGGGEGEDGEATDSGDGNAHLGSPPPPPPNSASSEEEASPESGGDGRAGWTILKDVSDPGSALEVGVHMGDGDGTVPLLSLGLMCRRGWRPYGPLNPGGMRIVTREFKHRSVSLLQDSRGGPATAAHIDILGNEAVLHDIIRVATGRLDELSDVIHSDIDRIAAAVDL